MSDLEKRIAAIADCLLAEDPVSRDKAHVNLKKLMNNTPTKTVDPETIVREIFLELGAPDHLKGHAFAVYGILLVAENRMYIDNIVFGLYAKIASEFDTTASRVERAIRHVVETTWTRGDPDTLFRYFGNTVSADKGKPTNGEFIARIASIVNLRMRGIA